MNLIKPKKLNKGDTIAFIAPSGFVSEDKIYNAKKIFEEHGYKVKLGENIFKHDRYMAGTDKERISDLEWAFSDKTIDAIVCVRGGYGAIRLINNINYEIIKSNPKMFCGYSDITALSLMIYKKTGLITFSSPMPKGDFQPNELDDYTQKHFWSVVENDNTQIKPFEQKIYRSGNCQGILWGGNLATVSSLCGLDFLPDENFIFFAEDLNEPVYKLDKYFRQLLNIEKFKRNLSGIILGDFLDVNSSLDLEALFKEIATELKVPVLGGYKISHSKTKVTLPIGAYASLKDGIIKVSY